MAAQWLCDPSQPSLGLYLSCHALQGIQTPHCPCPGSAEGAGGPAVGPCGSTNPWGAADGEGCLCWGLAGAADSAVLQLAPTHGMIVNTAVRLLSGVMTITTECQSSIWKRKMLWLQQCRTYKLSVVDDLE